jgi:hypothetical protein
VHSGIRESFRPRGVDAVHLVYLDEVKPNETERYFWLCGFALHEDHVQEVEEQVQGIASKFFGSDILSEDTEFHASHIVSKKRQFRKRKQEDCAGLLKDLMSVLGERDEVLLIQVRLEIAALYANDPVSYAFLYFVERTERLMRKLDSRALLIADAPAVPKHVGDLHRYKLHGTPHRLGMRITRILDTVHHTDSAHSRLLQLADVYAYVSSLQSRELTGATRDTIRAHLKDLPYMFPKTYKHWPYR